MKIGLYGGSFNPPHLMHEKIAKTCLEKKIVDKIIFLPTSNFYPKKGLIDDIIRLDMLKIMIKEAKNMEVSDYEFQKRTYTYETLKYFKEKYPKDEIVFLMGSDNFNELETWKNYLEILENYQILVINRKGSAMKWKKEFQKYESHIKVLDFDLEALSSTEIRNEIKERNFKRVTKKISPQILEFIKKKNLYSE